MRLLAIDPGDNHTHKNMGWAWFGYSHLMSAGEGSPLDIEQLITSAEKIVFEYPEIYRSRHSRGDPNHLLRLVEQIGFIKARANLYCKFVEVLPKTWKGQVPKAIVHDRARSILSMHDALGPPSNQHNAWDAIALGLWHLNRHYVGSVKQ